MSNFQVASWIERGNVAYFVPFNANVLVEYDIKNKETKKVYDIDTDFFVMGAFIEIVQCEDELVLIPLHYNKIVIFDCNSKRFRYVDIPNIEQMEMKTSLFSKGIIKDNYLFLVGHNYHGVLRLDLNTDTVTIINDYVDNISNIRNNGAYLVELDVAFNECYIYMISAFDGKLVEINMDSCKSTVYTLNGRKCNTLTWMNGYLWLISDGQYYIKWDRSEGVVDEGIISVIIPDIEDKEKQYRRSIGLNEKILLVSTECEFPLIVVDCFNVEESESIYLEDKGVSAYFPNISNGAVTFWDAYSKMTCVWNGKRVWKQCWSEEKAMIPYFVEKARKGIAINEKEMDINSYLQMLRDY